MPKGRLKEMRPRLRDLFGEIPVTVPEVEAWMLAVPRMDPHGQRGRHYIKWYDVVGKIRQAKADGRLDELLGSVAIPQHWWQRFSWAYR